ncbi:MAG TPA: DUF1549 domain-containing protein [Verrucomicrobiales bacterium]|nr:DUF1549 domain-containing protein [Verrucomicrobiales bacterium]
MKRFLFLTTFLALPAAYAETKLELHTGIPGGKPAVLKGKDASLQLVATAVPSDKAPFDVTRSVTWTVEPASVLTISKTGVATPLTDGTATVIATSDGTKATATINVTGAASWRTASFTHEIVPLFTKYGCNGGGCHGKSEGQNGFKLSLLGFEPGEDYEHLVFESRGRRLFPAAPENSLLMLKATGEMPHGGGARMERGTPDYLALVRWMEQGAPPGNPDDPHPVSISVFPPERLLQPESTQQLQVTAQYSDDSFRDITTSVQYDSAAKDMLEVSSTGLVKAAKLTGDAAVMIRYKEMAGVFRATIPLGAPMGEFPPERNFIDRHVFAKLRTLGLPPSAVCDDATFLRRVTLDIAGRVPTTTEAESFAADKNPDKRTALVDRLLASTDYAEYFAGKWSALLRNKRGNSPARTTYAFHGWLRESLNSNKPYDQFVREILAASGSISGNPATGWYRAVTKSQDQLQDVAQVFCGQRLQCAQCHHHPYEKWSQQDYYGFAAFFSTVARKPADEPGEEAVFNQWRDAFALNPKTQKNVKPTPLGGQVLALKPQDDPRRSLASWLTAPENPFFAKMLVNRYWKHFFGRGLVEPEDDMRVTNPATNPELMDGLAHHFTESKFNLKALVRSICLSSTYQLSSLPNEHNATDRQNFSRFFPRRLPAEVLLDAIDTVTGIPTKFAGQPAGARAVALPDDSFNAGNYFLTVFGRPDNTSACECERSQDSSLAQSLHLLNSKGLQEKLSGAEGRAAALAKDKAAPEDRIRRVFLTLNARTPTAEETKKALDYVTAREGKPAAWEDLIWALINSKEFLFNH